MTAADPPSSARSDDLERRISRAIGRARAAAVWEVVWRRTVPILWVGGLHVALSWLGFYAVLPPIGRWVVVAGLLLLLAAAVVRAAAGRGELAEALDRGRAVRRVEAASGLSGHELVGLTDRLAGDAAPATRRLWAIHRARLETRVGRLAAGWPHPDLGRRDRHALRPLLGFALFAGWFAAGDDHLARLVSPFATTTPVPAEDRLDAWIDPPAYTGRPPTVLIAEGRPPVGGAAGETLPAVPQGSRLVVRAASGRADRPAAAIVLTVLPTGGVAEEITGAADEPGTAGAPIERVAKLVADAEVRLTRDGVRLADWKITVVRDAPPTVRLVGRPETQASGAIKLTHETGDDWGVTSAEARFAPVGRPSGRPLYPPPSFPLALPLGRAHTGTTRTMRDVTAHPFAGSVQSMTLAARDEAGQEGVSEAVELTLPQRPFRKPLARALIELRRRLALDAGEVAVVITALDALTLAPERFEEKSGVHLGLRLLRQQATAARGDDELREVVDLLWAAATSIEDGDLAEHEKALRQAQEALRKALEEGASPEEIARLTNELRAAMETFLAAKAEQGRRETRRDPAAGPRRTITDRDIRRMLDRIENLARTGSREAAEKLLEELRELMENLQTGSAAESGDDSSNSEALEKLGEMIHRQQKLMEETHRSRREGAYGEGNEEMEGLGRSQNDLREALRRFSEEMRGRGEGRGEAGRRGESGGEGGDDLEAAGEAMGRAGEALERGEGEEALDAQAKALEGLRRGARKLGDRMSRRGGGARESDEDPLGRPRRRPGETDSDQVKVPDEIDVERARRILDDIRKRLGEPARPKFERDYLDRLLKLDPGER